MEILQQITEQKLTLCGMSFSDFLTIEKLFFLFDFTCIVIYIFKLFQINYTGFEVNEYIFQVTPSNFRLLRRTTIGNALQLTSSH